MRKKQRCWHVTADPQRHQTEVSQTTLRYRIYMLFTVHLTRTLFRRCYFQLCVWNETGAVLQVTQDLREEFLVWPELNWTETFALWLKKQSVVKNYVRFPSMKLLYNPISGHRNKNKWSCRNTNIYSSSVTVIINTCFISSGWLDFIAFITFKSVSSDLMWFKTNAEVSEAQNSYNKNK